MASTTPTYDGLNVDQRLAFEQLLFERLTGSSYTERSIPSDASDKKREYLVSCLRDANHRMHEGPVPQHQVSAVREFSARATRASGAALLVTPADLQERAAAVGLRSAEQAPFDLDSLEQAAKQAVIDSVTPAKPIPRRKITEKALKPLGYQYVKEKSSSGTLAFAKTSGGAYHCNFDFGSWRRTVVVIFVYSGVGCRLAIPVCYSRSGKEIAILNAELFEQTMANVAYVLGEIETVLT